MTLELKNQQNSLYVVIYINLIITIDFFFWCSEEVIIEIERGHHVTRGELMCLKSEKWINDQVINV